MTGKYTGQLALLDRHHLFDVMALQQFPFLADIVMGDDRRQTHPWVTLQQGAVGGIAGHEGEQKLRTGADGVIEDHQCAALRSCWWALVQGLDVVKAGDWQSVGFEVDVRDQITALAHKGARKVAVAATLGVKTVLLQVGADPLVQQSAFANQPCPPVHLHAVEQPQGDRLIARIELIDPATQGRALDFRFVPGLSQLVEFAVQLVRHGNRVRCAGLPAVGR